MTSNMNKHMEPNTSKQSELQTQRDLLVVSTIRVDILKKEVLSVKTNLVNALVESMNMR